METLPDDVLVEIASHLLIDDLFAFRESNHKVYRALQERITGLSEQVAVNTFPGQRRVLCRSSDQQPSLAWLNELRYKQLAAIVIEHFDHVSTEDPLGDHMRAKITEGWKVIQKFSRLAKEVSTTCASSRRSHRNVNESDVALEIASHWQGQVPLLGLEGLQGLRYLWGSILPRVLNADALEFDEEKNYLDTKSGNWYGANDKDEWYMLTPPRYFRFAYWAMWTVFTIGPRMFWKAWWIENGASANYLGDRMHDYWQVTTPETAVRQFEVFYLPWAELERRARRISTPLNTAYGCGHVIVDGLPWRLNAVRAWRKHCASIPGEPRFAFSTSSVVFNQRLRFHELGPEVRPRERPSKYAVDYDADQGWNGPEPVLDPARFLNALQASQETDAREERALDDIRRGVFTLPP